MYISRLEVDGFRSLSNVKINDMKPITLFFGKNGVGKSSILALIETIFCAKAQREGLPGEPVLQTPFYRGVIPNFTNNYPNNKPAVINFGITISMTISELKSKWPEHIKHGIKVLAKNLPEDRVRLNITGSFIPLGDQPQNAIIETHMVDVNGYVVYDATKNPNVWLPAAPSQVILATREKIGESLLANFTGCFSNIGIARFLQKESVISNQGQAGSLKMSDSLSEFKTRLFKAKQSLNQDDQERYRLIRNTFESMTRWGEIDFARREGEDRDLEVMTWDENDLWLPVALRGAGAEQLLVIMSEVILRNKSIIGIEELESNLDEDTQGKLIDLLREMVEKSSTQVGQIISTAHSCFYGYTLPKHEKKYVIRKTSGNTEVENWSDKAFQSLFDRTTLGQSKSSETRQKPRVKAINIDMKGARQKS